MNLRRWGLSLVLLGCTATTALAGQILDPGIGWTVLPDGGLIYDPEVTVEANSTGSAVAGPYERAGKTETTTKAAADREDKHAKEYNGPTDFKANYTIKLNADKSLDQKNSSVYFITLNYTAKGKLVDETKLKKQFTTPPITITGVTLKKDGSVESFTFSGTDWYDPNANGANGLKNNGLSGSINLATGAASYTASYALKSNGAVYTYEVAGKIGPGKGGGGAGGGGPESDFPYALPEPATWTMLAGALPALALFARRARGHQ